MVTPLPILYSENQPFLWTNKIWMLEKHQTNEPGTPLNNADHAGTFLYAKEESVWEEAQR